MTMSVYETFYCLNILPAGSDLSAKPPSGWYLWCFLANPLARPSLSLVQGVCFDTPEKHMLKD
jgi:hypothetical protein